MMRERDRMGDSEAALQPGPQCKRFAPLLPLLFQDDLLEQDSQDTEALREHFAGCSYCRTMIAIYATQEQVLRQNFAARITASTSYAEQITERLQEKRILSQLPLHTVPSDWLSDMLDLPESTERRLEATQQLTAQSSRRRTHPLAGWLAPVAALLLIALLATLVFTKQRLAGIPAPTPAVPPYVLAPGVDISLGVVSMVAPNEGWAIAFREAGVNHPGTHSISTILLHDHHGTWSSVTLASKYSLNDISMVSPTDGWGVGDQGLIMHYDGVSWARVKSPTDVDLGSIKMLSATDGWVIAGLTWPNYMPNSWPTILHYDGHSWQNQPVPDFLLLSAPFMQTHLAPGLSQVSSVIINDFQPQPDGEIWALAGLSNTVLSATRQNISTQQCAAILHYDGYQWHVQDTVPNVILSNLSMISPQEGWMLGITQPVMTGDIGTPITGNDLSSFFLLHYAYGELTRVPARQVIQQLPPGPSGSTGILQTLAMASPTDGWLIGYWMVSNKNISFLLHYTGDHWVPVSLPALPNLDYVYLSTVSIQPNGEVWAYGSIVRTFVQPGQKPYVAVTPLLLHYTGGDWSVVLD
jgi:hypothetical protein